MKTIYSSPMRVYLVLGALALFGIYAGFNLPISLFPNSSKPAIMFGFKYSNSTAEEFINTFGNDLEYQVHSLATEKVKVDKLFSTYRSGGVEYFVEFAWGTPSKTAERELRNTVNAFTARLPTKIRDSFWMWTSTKNTGFFAASFYSSERDLNDVYDVIEPILSPQLSKIADAQDPGLYNPSNKEIRVELDPEAMAALQLLPRNIELALEKVLASSGGGNVTIGNNKLSVQLPRQIITVEDLESVVVPTSSGKAVHLSDLGRIDYGPVSNAQRSFKTSGAESLILFATPRPDGNIKRMSEDLLEVVRSSESKFPPDISYKVLVDPSQFIRASVRNVFHEVILAALIAVGILFLFIGSAKNVATAAIEIPLSMVLAFILMRYFEMNLNLISLGGLALSAGMNVDASVVVIENIFRHFEMKKGPHSRIQRLNIICEAVNEVRFPVIASTISSLVVFVPLAFTSALTSAILGDLAKAVIFSHGFSAFVALILVPTIRLQLMAKGNDKTPKSPIDGPLHKLESWYANLLSKFIDSAKLKWGSYLGLISILAALSVFVLPLLKREIVGRPDTDWLMLQLRTKGNTLLAQMETLAEENERKLLENLGDEILYTFNQIRGPNRATLMARLRDKSKVNELWKSMEKEFTDTPVVRFRVFPWNPSQLPIPDPPHFSLSVRGRNDVEQRAEVAKSLKYLLKEDKTYDRVWTEPNVERDRAIVIEPHQEQWSALREQGSPLSPNDLSDIVRTSTEGRRIGRLPLKGVLTDIMLRLPKSLTATAEDIGAIPIGINEKIVPLKSLASVKVSKVDPITYRENLQNLFLVEGRHNMGEEEKVDSSLVHTTALVEKWEKEHQEMLSGITVTVEDSFKELNEALEQLGYAVLISIALILLTMFFQFGRIVPAFIVLVSVPLGFVGVIASLYIFSSTLSLNSALGVILLNGIAVANSIILVDFILKLHDRGLAPREAAVSAARKRLRPILITSLTTVLGMLPIALGFGDGGKILQPLGIAVSCGLWVSTLLTLFLVPALQVSYLEFKVRSQKSSESWNSMTPEPQG